MTKIPKTTCEINIVEADGKETTLDNGHLLIESHWDYDTLVVLELAGKRITVGADVLIDACKRCSI